VPVYVDSAVAAEEQSFFQAGSHTVTIRMTYADFARLERPQVLSFSGPTPALSGQ